MKYRFYIMNIYSYPITINNNMQYIIACHWCNTLQKVNSYIVYYILILLLLFLYMSKVRSFVLEEFMSEHVIT